MIHTVWLVPVFLIPGAGSLPFRCRLLLVFVDTCLHAAGCLDSFSAVCWVGRLYDLALTFPILPLGFGRIQAVSVVCLSVLPCHMFGSSRRCPGCLLLASGACLSFCYLWLLSLGFLPSSSSLVLNSILL